MSTNSIYTPYGAYELKASYQKNMLMGNLFVLSMVVFVLSILWLKGFFEDPSIVIPPGRELIVEWKPNPLDPIKFDRSNVRGQKPEIVVHAGAIPIPISDEEFPEEDIPELRRSDTPAEINGDGIDSLEVDFTNGSVGGAGYGEVIGDYPGETEFVPFEKIPEMYYNEQPIYPRLCRLAGIEGEVIIKALVGKDGLVKKVLVAKSSGNESLDDAAIAAAYKNKFTPALQNSYPISLWVSYKVIFSLK